MLASSGLLLVFLKLTANILKCILMIESITREDSLDDASYQCREVYAQYGLVMFYAQTLEQSLINVLTTAQMIVSDVRSQALFDKNFDKNFSVTMGRLRNRFKPFLDEDSELAENILSYWAGDDVDRINHCARSISRD